jgi:hypothetical protein
MRQVRQNRLDAARSQQSSAAGQAVPDGYEGRSSLASTDHDGRVHKITEVGFQDQTGPSVSTQSVRRRVAEGDSS